MYEIGKVYIWQNVPQGGGMPLNGVETIVTGSVEEYQAMNGLLVRGQPTDTPDPRGDGRVVMAPAGYLRPKNPPPGERAVRDLFTLPEAVPA